MYSKEQLKGILLSLAVPEIVMFTSKDSKMPYDCRLRIVLRSTNPSLLKAIQRTLNQHMIKSVLKSKENKQRVGPILILGNRNSLRRVINLLPENVPRTHTGWDFFEKMLSAIEENKHLDEDGILEMKEWYDDNKEQRKTNNISR